MPLVRTWRRTLFDTLRREIGVAANPQVVEGMAGLSTAGIIPVHLSAISDAVDETGPKTIMPGFNNYTYPNSAGEAVAVQGQAADTSKDIIVKGLDANWDYVEETIQTDPVDGSIPVDGAQLFSRVYAADCYDNTAVTAIAVIDAATHSKIFAYCSPSNAQGTVPGMVYSIPADYTGYITKLCVGYHGDDSDDQARLQFGLYKKTLGTHTVWQRIAGQFELLHGGFGTNESWWSERTIEFGIQAAADLGLELPAQTDVELRGGYNAAPSAYNLVTAWMNLLLIPD